VPRADLGQELVGLGPFSLVVALGSLPSLSVGFRLVSLALTLVAHVAGLEEVPRVEDPLQILHVWPLAEVRVEVSML